MVPSFLSFASLYSSYLRRCFIKAGLSQQFIQVDDQTTIHCWVPKPELKDTHKPSLVLIHGFGPISLWQWRQQVHTFTTHFNVYVPDLIFFGKSITKSYERSEIFQADSVANLLEKLAVKKYSVVGTSYGGFISYHLARKYPDRVDKVVIASSGVNMTRRDNEELIKRAKLENVGDFLLPQTVSHLRTLLGLAIFRPLRMVPDFVLNDIINKLYEENRDCKLELLKEITLGKDETTNISPLEQDVLIIWGEHDQIFPVKMAHELKGLLGKNVKVEIMRNTSHVPQIEQPRQFNSMVQNFLSS